MSLARKLTCAYALRHPTRMFLASLATIASACVVVWVVSSYDALRSQFGPMASEYLGRYDAFVVPVSEKDPFVAAELIDALRKDAAIAEVQPASQSSIRLVNPDADDEMGGPSFFSPSGGGARGAGARSQPPSHDAAGPGQSGRSARPSSTGGPPQRPGARGRFPFFMPSLVGTTAAQPPYPLIDGKWIDPQHADRRQCALDSGVAKQLAVTVGGNVLVVFGTKEFRLKVIGIVDQHSVAMAVRSPSALPSGPATAAVYVPLALADKLTRQTAKVNLVNLKLREGSTAADVRRAWSTRLATAKPPAEMLGIDDIRANLEESMMAANARRQAWAATGMSLLAALFIIFTTLSMGVNERIRQFAVMRAVGLSRGQVMRVIAAEAIVLALIGWAGGLAAGWAMLALASRAQPALFSTGGSLGTWCVLLTGASAFGGALLASILPAWQATRVHPLEAMSPRRSTRPSVRWSAIAGVVGVGLIAVNPLLVYVVPVPDAARYAIYEAIGCSSMAVGFLLLAPLTILVTETVFTPGLGLLVGLQPRLLSAQLSSNLWRTLGTTVALTIGLGLYVALQVWGYSMLQPFVPGDWVPDALVSFQRGGLPDTEIEAIRSIPGVDGQQCIPLAVEQPKLAEDITGSHERTSVARQDNVIVIGLDPNTAFGGDDPLIKLDFVRGNRHDALAKLAKGPYCIVPDHFLDATGLNLGDRFTMIPPESPDKRVEYTIAGAVSLPGWHWMTKFSGLRRRSGRSAAMVFAPYDQVRRDFGLSAINFFWMNIDKNVGVDAIGAALRPIAERNPGVQQPVNQQGTWNVGAQNFGPSVRISTPDEVRSRIGDRADAMIWAMCQLPLITLLVTSLGVINTVMASVRARRWELGVMRSLGVTRSGLFRMILVEGLLIGLITCLLSLGFGIMAGWCGMGISQYVSFFGGMPTPLVIPWARLAIGLAVALGLCLAAALWPAFTAGRSEPLALLQQGRTAM